MEARSLAPRAVAWLGVAHGSPGWQGVGRAWSIASAATPNLSVASHPSPPTPASLFLTTPGGQVLLHEALDYFPSIFILFHLFFFRLILFRFCSLRRPRKASGANQTAQPGRGEAGEAPLKCQANVCGSSRPPPGPRPQPIGARSAAAQSWGISLVQLGGLRTAQRAAASSAGQALFPEGGKGLQ